MSGLLIGEVAEQTGTPTPTIRYYERIGLLTAAPRSAAGYRRYPARTVHELRFIRKAQALGFTLDEVGEILRLSRSGQKPCTHVIALTRQHLQTMGERIARLQEFQAYLAGELARWERQKVATTCDGLCQFITDAEPAGPPAPVDVRASARRTPARRRQRRG